jgi:hypothetical protein
MQIKTLVVKNKVPKTQGPEVYLTLIVMGICLCCDF